MYRSLTAVLFFLFTSMGVANAAQPEIDGLWEAKYEASNTPSAHIRLNTQPSGEVIGVIEQAFPRPGAKDPSPNCINCKGADKDKPIIGLKVLWGMMPDGENQWNDGHVLDAETGKVYSGKMSLADNGNTINLRGYILTPMLGQTATWTRIK